MSRHTGALRRFLTSEIHACPSCTFQRAARRALYHSAAAESTPPLSTSRRRDERYGVVGAQRRRHSASNARHNSSLVSSTAVNPPSTVPSAYEELHSRLVALQDPASGFADLSRLQLALRSLESDSPTVRVAFLGLGSNGVEAARKLARVLLADALGSEEEWEKQLLADAGDGRGLLLRYGDEIDTVSVTKDLVQIIDIPSPFLKRHGLEILVTGFSTGGLAAEESEELESQLLVPSLTIPNTSRGQVGFVRYPVHMALLVGEGVEGAVEAARILELELDAALVGAALDLPVRPDVAKGSIISTTGQIVDTSLASHALALFRTSKANGAQFSHEWEASNVPATASFITSASLSSSSSPKPAITATIASLLTSTTTAINDAETTSIQTADFASVPSPKRAQLLSDLTSWSASAHKDLQLNLTAAFASPTWRRTAWFRLLWRIDDVSQVSTHLLQHAWLREAELELACLSGKLLSGGLATPATLREPEFQALVPEGMQAELVTHEKVKDQEESVAELMQLPTLLSRVKAQSGLNPLFNPPWPQTIALARMHLIHTLIPPFHARAQALLLQSLTTTAATSALGVWLVVATSGVAVYEAGAVAALGLVWSLRRLQKKWGIERTKFAGDVSDFARRALSEVEGHLRKVVESGGRVEVQQAEVEGWARARKAVEDARQALAEVQQGSSTP
nr:hypothetical protein B0A51_12870 [Rachicladosporium sp. CCFEE 5018]